MDGVYIPEGAGEIHMAGKYVNVYGNGDHNYYGKTYYLDENTSYETAGTEGSFMIYKVLSPETVSYRDIGTTTVRVGAGQSAYDKTVYYNNSFNINKTHDEYSEPTGVKITNADPNLKETRPINTAVRYLIRAK